jgi:chromosome segregation ATPase
MSEMTTSEACAATAQFGRFIKGMARLQEVAAALEGADQLIRERQARADQVLATITEAQAQLEEVQSHVTAANEAAASTTAAAEAKAAEILSAARDEADKTLSESNAELERIRSETHSLVVRADAARQALDAAEKEHANISSRISEAQAKARAIIGAE